MSSINQKLGLRPRTRARTATHGSTIVSDAICPSCGKHNVREAVLNRIVTRRCDICGASWRPNGEPDGSYRDGIGNLRWSCCLSSLPNHASDCRREG